MERIQKEIQEMMSSLFTGSPGDNWELDDEEEEEEFDLLDTNMIPQSWDSTCE